MATMRMTIYAVLAVAVGIALVGVLPTQLAVVTNKQVGGGPVTLTSQGNRTLGSETNAQQAKTDSTNATLSVETDQAKTAADAAQEPGKGLADVVRAQEEFNANVKYYGLWVVNLMVALGVYFLAKRRLG